MPVRVLALDGGGIRGIVPATVLAELERRTDKRVAELFDLIAGTSTGGILALALTAPAADDPTRPRYAAAELIDLYAKHGPEIFARRPLMALRAIFEERYPKDGLERILATYFGESRLKDAVTEVLVTSYDLEARDPWFFARHKARESADSDFPLRLVARATSAAPTYFEPLRLTSQTAMVDGGVFANNPGMCGYVEAIKLHGPGDVLVVSVGTGQVTTPIHYADAKGWGEVQWVRPVLDVAFDGVSDTVDHQLSWLLSDRDGKPRYVRFQIELPSGMGSMDDTSAAHVAALKEQGAKLVVDSAGRLDAVCGLLESLPEPA